MAMAVKAADPDSNDSSTIKESASRKSKSQRRKQKRNVIGITEAQLKRGKFDSDTDWEIAKRINQSMPTPEPTPATGSDAAAKDDSELLSHWLQEWCPIGYPVRLKRDAKGKKQHHTVHIQGEIAPLLISVRDDSLNGFDYPFEGTCHWVGEEFSVDSKAWADARARAKHLTRVSQERRRNAGKDERTAQKNREVNNKGRLYRPPTLMELFNQHPVAANWQLGILPSPGMLYYEDVQTHEREAKDKAKDYLLAQRLVTSLALNQWDDLVEDALAAMLKDPTRQDQFIDFCLDAAYRWAKNQQGIIYAGDTVRTAANGSDVTPDHGFETLEGTITWGADGELDRMRKQMEEAVLSYLASKLDLPPVEDDLPWPEKEAVSTHETVDSEGTVETGMKKELASSYEEAPKSLPISVNELSQLESWQKAKQGVLRPLQYNRIVKPTPYVVPPIEGEFEVIEENSLTTLIGEGGVFRKDLLDLSDPAIVERLRVDWRNSLELHTTLSRAYMAARLYHEEEEHHEPELVDEWTKPDPLAGGLIGGDAFQPGQYIPYIPTQERIDALREMYKPPRSPELDRMIAHEAFLLKKIGAKQRWKVKKEAMRIEALQPECRWYRRMAIKSKLRHQAIRWRYDEWVDIRATWKWFGTYPIVELGSLVGLHHTGKSQRQRMIRNYRIWRWFHNGSLVTMDQAVKSATPNPDSIIDYLWMRYYNHTAYKKWLKSRTVLNPPRLEKKTPSTEPSARQIQDSKESLEQERSEVDTHPTLSRESRSVSEPSVLGEVTPLEVEKLKRQAMHHLTRMGGMTQQELEHEFKKIAKHKALDLEDLAA